MNDLSNVGLLLCTTQLYLVIDCHLLQFRETVSILFARILYCILKLPFYGISLLGIVDAFLFLWRNAK